VQHMVLASVDEGWSFGGSILTFLVPMLAFVAVAVTLLVLYTKPGLVPGRAALDGESPVSATKVPGMPASGGQAPGGSPTSPDGPGADAGKSGEPVSAE
jgi:hypothetical protein